METICKNGAYYDLMKVLEFAWLWLLLYGLLLCCCCW
jgi:hypothetical protein